MRKTLHATHKEKQENSGCIWFLYIVLMYIVLVFFLITFSCLRACRLCPCGSVSETTLAFCALSVWVALFSVSAMALVSIWPLLLWSIIWAFSSIFLYSFPLFPCFFFFYSFSSVSPRVPLNPRCLSLITRRLLQPSVCPSVLPSFLPSLLTPMQRLSLWQTCAITRTLSIIARLSIKGVISPQCPMPWQEWVPPRRSRPCPVVPGPSATSMTASSARPVRRPSRGSR